MTAKKTDEQIAEEKQAAETAAADKAAADAKEAAEKEAAEKKAAYDKAVAAKIADLDKDPKARGAMVSKWMTAGDRERIRDIRKKGTVAKAAIEDFIRFGAFFDAESLEGELEMMRDTYNDRSDHAVRVVEDTAILRALDVDEAA